MSTKFVPKHKHDENPNPKLLKFVRRVTDRIPGKIKGIKTTDPEYWGFACIFEDEFPKDESEACLDLLLQMKAFFSDICDAAGANPASPANPGRIDKRKPIWTPFVDDLKRSGPLTLQP